MSFQPSRSPLHQQNTRGSLNGLGLSSSKGGNFFAPERTLPMYKDKPYFTPRRTTPRRRWKYIGAVLGVCALVFLWYSNSSPPLASISSSSDKGEQLWKWMQTMTEEAPSAKVDWEARREKVRDAFIVSFEGYEKDAWGKSSHCDNPFVRYICY